MADQAATCSTRPRMNAPVEARGGPACSTLPSSNCSVVGQAVAGGKADVPLALIWPVQLVFTDPIIWTVFKANQTVVVSDLVFYGLDR